MSDYDRHLENFGLAQFALNEEENQMEEEMADEDDDSADTKPTLETVEEELWGKEDTL